MVLASKSIRAISNGWPHAEIHLLTSTEAAEIARHYRYIDRIWAFPIRELRKKKSYLLNMLKTLMALRRHKFDFALNLYTVGSWTGALKMGLLFLMVNTKDRIGVDHKGFGLLLTKKAPAELFQQQHFTDAMLKIAVDAGGIRDDKGLDAFWCEADEEKWEFLFSGKKQKRPVIGINPGGDRMNRRWSLENYASVADTLIDKLNPTIVVLGGPGEEQVAGCIQDKMKNSVINLSGKLTLNQLSYIISRFDLLITNDSGPMHIAAAVMTPLVAIFGPENPASFSPYMPQYLFRIVYKEVSCRPCKKKHCDDPICIGSIKPDEVTGICLEMLGANPKNHNNSRQPLEIFQDQI
jgi:ADP-heptose:LPS heptosyltransferase